MHLRHLIVALLLLLTTGAPAALYYPGVTRTNLTWTNGVVPYLFDTNYPVTSPQQTAIVNGMNDWTLGANVSFVPRTTQTQYLLIRYIPGSGIDSVTGGVPMIMTIDSLSRGQITHETGHALGLQHEHVRLDRTNFVNVITTNLQPSAVGLYAIETNGTMFGSYDFESVMSYSRTLFSLDPATRDVIVPTGTNLAKYYNRISGTTPTPRDLAGITNLYGAGTPLTNIVTNTRDTGPGSLRAAIYFANAHPGKTISFNIPVSDPGYGAGIYTISVTGFLPALTADGTIIDATTQPGYSNRPVVFISGASAPPQSEVGNLSAFYVYAANTVIKGLALGHFNDSGVFYLYSFATNNTLQASHVGVRPDGTNPAPNQIIGVRSEQGAAFNRIGGTNAAARNVISGNTQYGIWLGTNSRGNVVQGNYIGTDASGMLAVSNGLSGVGLVQGTWSNLIGGATAGAGNVISGNTEYGIGIFDTGTSSNTIQGNLIGLNATGSNALANRLSGIGVFGDITATRIGGTNTAARNIISGNAVYGIQLGGEGCSNNVIEGNFIGTSRAGTGAVPNAYSGVGIFYGPHHNTVGPGNVISGNASVGLQMAGAGASSNLVIGNLIGLASNGLTALGNTNSGVFLHVGVVDNIIGGTNASARNVISGNGGDGVTIADPESTGNVVLGNYCGTSRLGTNAVPNTNAGVALISGAAFNIIGGSTPGAGNVLSGNHREGLFAGYAGTADNVIQGNVIGTAPGGSNAVPNQLAGIALYDNALRNIVGGAGLARNVISGNQREGVFIGWGGSAENVIQGNIIGLNGDGTAALGNGDVGIYLYVDAVGNLIGGDVPNVVSGNSSDGIALGFSGNSNNWISGNFIGTGPGGVGSFGNAGSGVSIFITAAHNTVGLKTDGSGQGNTIAWNGWDGITVYDVGSVGNTLRGNLIFSNGFLGFSGIRLVDNPGNDALDADDGPNHFQNHPVLTNAVTGSGWTALRGTLSSEADRTYLIDFYRSPTTDGLVNAEAYLGGATYSTDGSGDGTFLFLAPGEFPDQRFTATATDVLTGDTSELSGEAFTSIATNGLARPEVLPVFTNFTLLASNGFAEVQFAPASTGFVYQLQMSTNLLEWFTVTNFPGGIPFSYVDPTNRPHAFYRTLWP